MSTHPPQSENDDGQDTQSSEDAAHDAAAESADSPLQALLTHKRRKVAQLEEDTEVVQQVVASIYLDSNYDPDAAQQLHRTILSVLREIMQEHEEVDINEIIMALWMELARVSTELTEALEEAESPDDPGDQIETDREGSPGEPGNSLGSPTGPTSDSEQQDAEHSDDESTDAVAPMFQ